MTAFDGIFITVVVSFVIYLFGVIFGEGDKKKLAIIIPSVLLVLALLIILAFRFQWESSILRIHAESTHSSVTSTEAAQTTPKPTPQSTSSTLPAPPSTPPVTSDTESKIIKRLGDAPSSSDFSIVWSESFTEPFEGSYLTGYETKYVKSSKGYGVNFYSAPSATDEYKRGINLLDGTEVVVLARQNGLSCVIYYKESSGHYHAGWVNSDWLVDKYD